MGILGKLKREYERTKRRVEKEINRTDENLEKAAKSALKDLPSLLIAPLAVPSAWVAEGIVREFDPELANKIREKRNQAAVAILCGPSEKGKECRRKAREGVELEPEDLSEKITEEELAKFVDSQFDYIVLMYAAIAQASSDDVPIGKLEELQDLAETAFAELERANEIAVQFDLALPEEYAKVVSKAQVLLDLIDGEIDELRD